MLLAVLARRCALLGLWVTASCSAPSGPAAVSSPWTARPLPAAPEEQPELDPGEGPPGLDAKLIGRLAEGTFGPYLGPSSRGRVLAVWAAVSEAGARRWYSVMLDARGAPSSAVQDVAPAPNAIGLVKVTETPGGFAVIYSASSNAEAGASSTRISALPLGPRGERAGAEATLAHTTGEVLWVDARRAAAASVALWATSSDGAAEIRATKLPEKAASVAPAASLFSGAKAWQAVEFGDGLAVVAMLGGESSQLAASFVDEEGRALGRTEVARGKRFGAELDAARVGDALVVAWTEDEGLGERLKLAALGADARVSVSPARAALTLGEQRLIEILPASDKRGSAFLVWEDVGQAPRGERRLRLAQLSERATLQAPHAELVWSGEPARRPEFARKGHGVAALTTGAACLRDSGSCEATDDVPTFVELGANLEPIASEPLRLAPEEGQKAALAWGLRCSADTCSALGAVAKVPVPIYGIELRARSALWSALAHSPGAQTPAALDMRAEAETDPLADLAAVTLGEGRLVATLTQFDESTPYVRRTTPAPDGKLAPIRALLSVQASSALGTQPPQVVSYRARAPGGLDLVAAPDQRALLVWTALDQKRPEVFATLLGQTGKSLVQRMLTSGAGEVTQVAAAALPRGYVVGWIGDAEGAPRAFAAGFGSDLSRRAAPKPLSRNPGTAAGLSLAANARGVWVALVERQAQAQVLSVSRVDELAARALEPVVVRRLESGSLAEPRLAVTGSGLVLGWLERPSPGESGGARAFLVELGPDAKPRSEPVSVASSAGDIASLRLWCDLQQCQGALDCRPPTGHQLEAFDWTPGAAPRSSRIVWRSTIAADPEAFAVLEDGVVYADRRGSRGISRYVRVAWR